MYKLGTYVCYRSEGVCVITEIKRQNFGTLNELKDFYILSPIKDPCSKLFVPTDNAALVEKMRPLYSADKINLLVKDLLDKKFEWIEQARPRSNFFREILSDGKRDSLIMLIHTVYNREAELSAIDKHVTQGDMAAVAKAKKMLIDEFSVTTNIKTEQMLMSVINCEAECCEK